MKRQIYYCCACHFLYIPAGARDRSFCPDCGQAAVREATPEQQKQYEEDRIAE